MPSLIGLIMLMGIATKNSILLVEYAIMARARARHEPRRDALLDACHKRARPIVMTTHRHGRRHAADRARHRRADPSFRAPMAIAVIGGLITSTFLSLLVIPVVFTYVDDIEQFVRRQVRGCGTRSRTSGGRAAGRAALSRIRPAACAPPPCAARRQSGSRR